MSYTKKIKSITRNLFRHLIPEKQAKYIYSRIIQINCDSKRRPFIKSLKDALSSLEFDGKRLKNLNELSIISSNCFAGRIMQDLHIEYNSPTLGLYFMAPDYIEFLSNLGYYLKEAEIEFSESSKYPLGNERRAAWSHWYPIGLLGGNVEVHFLHYHSEKEASEKWHRRAKRVNLNNLLVIGMDQNLCSEKDIISFSKLPFENKIFFSTHNLPLKDVEYMPEFEGQDSVGDPYRKGHIFYKHLISHINSHY